MKKLFAAFVAALALIAAPVTAHAETFGPYEVGVVQPGASCGLATGDPRTGGFALIASVEHGAFIFVVANPSMSVSDGEEVAVTITVDSDTGTLPGIARVQGSIRSVAIPAPNIEAVVTVLTQGERMTFTVNGAEVGSVTLDATFDQALMALAACAGNLTGTTA